jgi:hypothetical protein
VTFWRPALSASLAGWLGLAGLAGCGNETERYCDELEEQRQVLAELAVSTGEGEDTLARTVQVLRGLHTAAPGDITDEWSTLVFAYQGLVEAFQAAGTTPGRYDPASPPAGVTAAEADRIADVAAELRSPRVLDAAEGLEQHARDVCQVDLGLSTRER